MVEIFLIEGTGRLTKENGQIYEGEFKDNVPCGQGKYTWPDGRTYEGEFADGRFHGTGKYSWPDGRTYEGEMCEGRIHGTGVYNWPDGRRYEGQFEKDRKCGQGHYFWPDGREAEGTYAKGQLNGEGVYNWPNGKKFEGVFKKDKPFCGILTKPDGDTVEIGEPEPKEEEMNEESRYNKEYYCVVSKIENVVGEHVKVHFHAHGDMSKGKIQPPRRSVMFQMEVGGRGIRPKEWEIEEEDDENIKGIITFPHKEGPLFFQYGRFGYSRCRIFQPPISDPVEFDCEFKSEYDENYYCEISHVKITKWDSIEINFHVHGDGSLGKLQSALTSRIYTKPVGRFTAVKALLCEKELKDAENIKGLLVFPFVNGPLYFQYGKKGYSRVELVPLDPESDDLPDESDEEPESDEEKKEEDEDGEDDEEDDDSDDESDDDDEEEEVKEEPSDSDVVELDIENTSSRYNGAYYCEVSHLTINPGENIIVTFHVHGNMSLGKLQPASSCKLYRTKTLGIPAIALDVKVEEEDDENIKGTLTFGYFPGEIWFMYGRRGYSRVNIYTPTPGEPADIEYDEPPVSQFNSSYFCEVLKTTVTPWQDIKVEFHVHGDMSLGAIKTPRRSLIYPTERGRKNKNNAIHYTIEERDNENMKGTLTFPFIFGPVWFTYGNCYSRVQLNP